MKMASMTVEEAAKWLRQAAELTASASKNWDNFERICQEMLESALAHGRSDPS